MPSADDPLEHLRSAVDQLAASDARSLVEEARAEARARVRSRLADLMERSMLEQVQDQIAPPSAPRECPTQPTERFANVELQSGPAWYVYGVINAAIGLEEPPSDVDASRPVQILTEGAVAAAVSEVDLDEFGEARLRDHLRDMNWVERVARAHEAVLDRIRAQATVIPMRMCTVYRSEAGVREMLRREADALCQAIDHLEGKAEWGVKAFADPGRMAGVTAGDEAEAAADSARGAAYMRQRRGERDRREQARRQLEEAAAQSHDRLCTLAGDGQVLPPQRPEVSGHVGDMVLNGVYLVGDDDRERFHAEVQVLEAEFAPRGVELELTGPWPAYNFVPGTIGAAW
jgi:hypothetical protein